MYISNKTVHFSYKSGSVIKVCCMGVHISTHLKEELAWLQINGFELIVISYPTEELRNKAILSLKQYCVYYYVLLSKVWDSNYSERGSMEPCSFLLRYVCV